MTDAQLLVQQMHRDLEPVERKIRHHPYLRAVEERRLEPLHLQSFVGEQWWIIPSDLRSIALLISRCERPDSQRFFNDVLQGESAALEAIPALAAALGMQLSDCAAYEPSPGAQAYSLYLAWLCLYGSDAEVAAALSVNFAAWGANCARMGLALQRQYGLRADDVVFFSQFAAAPQDVTPEALAVIDSGLQRGVEAKRITRAARMLQGYESMFWDTVLSIAER
uniref:Pyrroloquinoline quinone (PQQ) biosynthesis protein C n=1 Tax=Candidatus Kentrum sp. LFY TaxID=2126342 RepID=A0A450WN18_9GAMM|nr:MAG: Pyrroloquinoline quinone (PQQ) biosynthesis protein C [Candidatus Kentron sp. LFY]